MKVLKQYVIFISLFVIIAGNAYGTASTQIWNPSTDIQAVGTVHLGIDNYFTTSWPQDGGYSFPTDIGLTYGALPGLEIGIDGFYPSSAQYTFNAKYGIPESQDLPAFAVGGFNFGFDTFDGAKSADQNIVYGVVAKTFNIGRLTGGYYSGNKYILLNNDGEEANTGFILTWDKAITDKIWACVDYASGYSSYGSAFYGISYMFSTNTSVIFGYGTYNNGVAPTVTTQLDINL